MEFWKASSIGLDILYRCLALILACQMATDTYFAQIRIYLCRRLDNSDSSVRYMEKRRRIQPSAHEALHGLVGLTHSAIYESIMRKLNSLARILSSYTPGSTSMRLCNAERHRLIERFID